MKKLLFIAVLFAVACNELPKEKELELKASSFKAPIVDTIAVQVDTNAYILNDK